MGRLPREMTREARGRDERIPLGVHRMKLECTDIPEGYVGRWVNDEKTRLTDAQRGGYEFVMAEEAKAGDTDVSQREGVDSRISRVVGTNDDNTPRRAYLMKIRKDWYDEDQMRKQRDVNESEAALRHGKDSQGEPGLDGRYIPSTGIKIETTSRYQP